MPDDLFIKPCESEVEDYTNDDSESSDTNFSSERIQQWQRGDTILVIFCYVRNIFLDFSLYFLYYGLHK